VEGRILALLVKRRIKIKDGKRGEGAGKKKTPDTGWHEPAQVVKELEGGDLAGRGLIWKKKIKSKDFQAPEKT